MFISVKTISSHEANFGTERIRNSGARFCSLLRLLLVYMCTTKKTCPSQDNFQESCTMSCKINEPSLFTFQIASIRLRVKFPEIFLTECYIKVFVFCTPQKNVWCIDGARYEHAQNFFSPKFDSDLYQAFYL